MAVSMGITRMYMDMSIADILRSKYGLIIGMNAALFFEKWRNYGFEKARKDIPERTYYTYLEMLIEVGLVKKLRKGVYQIAPGYEDPVG
jgi:hypothetical protein